MRNKSELISASEVGDYVFCALAWRLRAEGLEPASLRAVQQAGIKWHSDHGREVARAHRLRAATIIFTALAVILGLLLALYLVLR